jgi:ATP-dependent Clp protease ATP-binding subunit ClpC
VARLIGSPPGYVGYGEGGQLTEAVRHHPYSVVLFDEIEKAHPDVFNVLLQIFDEGQLTDGSGRKVDFRNTVIIMTSNAGSRQLASRPATVGYTTPSHLQADTKLPHTAYRKALEETFTPEFLNRIDDIVVFRSLEIEDIERIVDLELKDLLARTDKLGYCIEITPEARHQLATIGYEQRYGVRALRRTLTERIEDPLSGLVVDGKLQSGGRVVVEPDGELNVILRVA